MRANYSNNNNNNNNNNKHGATMTHNMSRVIPRRQNDHTRKRKEPSPDKGYIRNNEM
jgi:hypothetical protein